MKLGKPPLNKPNPKKDSASKSANKHPKKPN